MATHGLDVTLVCPWGIPNNTVQDGVRILTFKRVARRMWRPILVPARLLRRLLPALWHVDIVHFHDIDLLLWMALVRLFRPVVYDVHENYAEEMLVRAWIPRLLRRPLYLFVRVLHIVFPQLFVNIVLAVPQQRAEFGHPRLRTILIRNYANAKLVELARDDYLERENRVLYTGGHYVENGSWLLLDIAEKLIRDNVPVVVVATDRFATDEYRRRFEREIAIRNLHTLAIVPRVPSYRIMDILNSGTMAVLPSLDVDKIVKSIPTRLFEYMAAGLPVVSSRVGIQADIIESTQCGVLVEPGDAKGFADAITRLSRDRALAKRLGQNGQTAFRQQYTWESQMPSLVAFYRSITL